MVDHFAHETGDACDEWSEQMTEWHQYWQRHVKPSRREVITCRPDLSGEQPHFADIVAPTGHVIEVQHSHISPTERTLRTSFYEGAHRGVAWIVDAREFWDRIETWHPKYRDRAFVGWVRRQLDAVGETGTIHFRWRHPRYAWLDADVPVFLDPGGRGEASQVFEGALFRILNASPGDPDRWDNYDPHSAGGSPDGEGPGGVGCFIRPEKLRHRYRLHLPEKSKTEDSSAYPYEAPHLTLSMLERGESPDYPVPTFQ